MSFECLKATSLAWDRMAELLFKPFAWETWVKLGFLGWLSYLFEGPSIGLFNPSFGHRPSADGKKSVCSMADSSFQSINWHPSTQTIVAIVCISAAVFIGLTLLLLALSWVKCRGRFMFIDALANGVKDSSLSSRWSKFSAQGNSLFVFQIFWSLCALLACLPFIGAGVWLLWKTFGKATLEELAKNPSAIIPFFKDNAALLAGGFSALLFALLVALAAGIVFRLGFDFGTVHMYKNGSGAWTAFKKGVSVAFANPWSAFKYLVALVCIELATQAAILAFLVATCLLCCIGCIALSLPFVWAVVMLPILSFRQLFTMAFIAQAGEEFKLEIKNLSTSATPPAV